MKKSPVMISTLVLLILVVKIPEHANLFPKIVMITIFVQLIPATGVYVQTKLLAVTIKMPVQLILAAQPLDVPTLL
jgi:hypothetical protein